MRGGAAARGGHEASDEGDREEGRETTGVDRPRRGDGIRMAGWMLAREHARATLTEVPRVTPSAASSTRRTGAKASIEPRVMGSMTSWTCADALRGVGPQDLAPSSSGVPSSGGGGGPRRSRPGPALCRRAGGPGPRPCARSRPGRGRRRGRPRRRGRAGGGDAIGRVAGVGEPRVPGVGVGHRDPQHPRPVRADQQRRARRVAARAAAARSRGPGRSARRSRWRRRAAASG